MPSKPLCLKRGTLYQCVTAALELHHRGRIGIYCIIHHPQGNYYSLTSDLQAQHHFQRPTATSDRLVMHISGTELAGLLERLYKLQPSFL